MKTSKRSYIPEFVYGSMDGLVTTFAIVTGSIGASLSPTVILVVGLANVFADAFSMGSSSYLAAVSEESVSGKTNKKPVMKSAVTFVSFVVVGLIPLAPFLISVFDSSFYANAIYVSVVVTMIAFAAVGFFSGVVAGKNPTYTALRNLLIGGTAALIAFGIGRGLSTLFGI